MYYFLTIATYCTNRSPERDSSAIPLVAASKSKLCHLVDNLIKRWENVITELNFTNGSSSRGRVSNGHTLVNKNEYDKIQTRSEVRR